MATGKIIEIDPSDNDGSVDGAGTVKDDSTGTTHVFFTPDDAKNAIPLSIGMQVSFTKNGELANSLQKA